MLFPHLGNPPAEKRAGTTIIGYSPLIDGNCLGWGEAHRTTSAVVDPGLFPKAVVGCPDPHIERWCIADPAGFRAVLDIPPLPDPGKCDRGVYKALFRESILRAAQPILTDPMEFAPDLVAAMDLYRASKNQPSLKHFIEDLRSAIRSQL